MYKLIAIDMDGTLLKEDKTVSIKTKEAIKMATDKGVKVVLASGRPIIGLEPYLAELGLNTEDDYVMSFNGSLVQNSKSKEIIFESALKGSDLKSLYELSKELGVNIHAFDTKGCITPAMSEYTELEGRLNHIEVDIVDFNEVSDDEDIIKVMFVDPQDKLEEAIKRLPKNIYDKYTIVRSAPFFLEFLNKESNKGVGVAALAKHLGINKEEVICMGDAGNDLAMIEYAGMGVAMANAFDEVKEAANFITLSNEEDGVAFAINKFV